MSHQKVDMKKNVYYKIITPKYISAHRARCGCNCSGVVLNLLGGLRVWTRVRFECEEMIKINCQALKIVK